MRMCVCAYEIGKRYSKWSEIPAGSSPAIVIYRKGLSTQSKAYSLRSQQDPTIMRTIRWWKIMNLFRRNASKLSLTIHFESQSTSSVGIYDIQRREFLSRKTILIGIPNEIDERRLSQCKNEPAKWEYFRNYATSEYTHCFFCWD